MTDNISDAVSGT